MLVYCAAFRISEGVLLVEAAAAVAAAEAASAVAFEEIELIVKSARKVQTQRARHSATL
jgi:hypothetical protein